MTEVGHIGCLASESFSHVCVNIGETQQMLGACARSDFQGPAPVAHRLGLPLASTLLMQVAGQAGSVKECALYPAALGQ